MQSGPMTITTWSGTTSAPAQDEKEAGSKRWGTSQRTTYTPNYVHRKVDFPPARSSYAVMRYNGHQRLQKDPRKRTLADH